MLDELEANDLYLKPEKCTFEQEEIEYLGVIIGKGCLCMDLKKLKGVADYLVPRNLTNVRAFLGLCGYYHYFIPHFCYVLGFVRLSFTFFPLFPFLSPDPAIPRSLDCHIT